MDEMDKIFKALELLRECGIYCRDLYCKKEFINKARRNRAEIDKIGASSKLFSMDTTFDCWVDKKEFILKKMGEDFEGMMLGINFRNLKK